MTNQSKQGPDPQTRINHILSHEVWHVLRFQPHGPNCQSTEHAVARIDSFGEDYLDYVPPSGPCDCWRSRLASLLQEAQNLIDKEGAKRRDEESRPDKEKPTVSNRYEDSGSGCG